MYTVGACAYVSIRNKQYSEDELKSDVEHYLELIGSDKTFKKEFQEMEKNSILGAIDGALSLLYYRQDPNLSMLELPEVYLDSCMVISLLQQWLTNHLCKKMLQVIKPEALLVHYKELKHHQHFLRSYTKQGHFCLKELIEKQLRLLKINQSSRYIL